MNLPAPFTQRQVDYFNRCQTSWFNIAEGGKRGGKNVLNTLAWCVELENHPNRFHLAAGVDQSSARINIIECDGFGVKNYFDGRYKVGKFEKKDCLYIDARSGKKIIFFAGGKKDGDESYIKGYTYGTAYITEANECHQKFIQEVFDRTLSSKNRKIYHDLNPKAEGHWYYENILNFHEKKQEKNPIYGYNYGHFTIADNMSITDEDLRIKIDTYDKDSVWYQRDILGKRKQAEGLVYPMFNKDYCVVPTIPRPYEKYYITNDYGTNHPLAFLLLGLSNGIWYEVKEFTHDGQKNGQKTSEEYYTDLLRFRGDLKITQLIKDNAPIASPFNVLVMRKGDFSSKLADNEVAPGIQDVATVLRNGTLKINDCCKNTIKEFGLYSWNPKSTDDEPIKENDDHMDALRYGVRTLRMAAPARKGLL